MRLCLERERFGQLHLQRYSQTFFTVSPQYNSRTRAGLTVEQKICKVFGKKECANALAISHAENGTRQCDRININKNGSFDVGIFQINSIHGYPLKDLVDCDKNIQYAYKIFTEQGNWSAWVTSYILNPKTNDNSKVSNAGVKKSVAKKSGGVSDKSLAKR